VTARSWGPRAN